MQFTVNVHSLVIFNARPALVDPGASKNKKMFFEKGRKKMNNPRNFATLFLTAPQIKDNSRLKYTSDTLMTIYLKVMLLLRV